mmetsp:Transcript_22202/g.24840  ORF Transcript_22202/g.24840 Transcript_22202/m.24840 type:complete len:86 (-) Transcript_22202:994-1251(-)
MCILSSGIVSNETKIHTNIIIGGGHDSVSNSDYPPQHRTTLHHGMSSNTHTYTFTQQHTQTKKERQKRKKRVLYIVLFFLWVNSK